MGNEIVLDAWTCLGCGKCTAACPVARTELGYSPRRLLLKAVQRDLDAAILDRALFACLACDRCASVCPSGISISGAMQQLRAVAWKRGIIGQPAHAGILQGLMRMMANRPEPQDRLGWLDPTVETSDTGDTIYFVGCAPYFQPLFEHLGADPLRTVKNAIRLMNHVGVVPRLLPDERCCGHDLLWQGDVDNFRRLAQRNLEQVRATGARTVVFTCPEGLRTFRLDYPRVAGPLGFEALHITELLARYPERMAPGVLDVQTTYHDPCRLGRHLGTYDAPREFLDAVSRRGFVEMRHSRESATCCGGTCWMECGAAVKSLQNRRLEEARRTGADRMVTACPKCDIHFRCALSAGPAEDAPRVENIVDLLAESLGLDTRPGGIGAPGGKKGDKNSAK